MKSNLIKTDNGYVCNKCSNNVSQKDNYCSVCGSPLSQEASMLREEQKLAIKLQTVKELVELTKDAKIIDYLQNLKK